MQGNEGIVPILNEKAKLYDINFEVMLSTLLWGHMTIGTNKMETVACYTPINADTIRTRNMF